MIVIFEETGGVREVKRFCMQCFMNPTTRSLRYTDMVSPKGVAHRGGTYNDRTRCGKDVTLEGWWCRL